MSSALREKFTKSAGANPSGGPGGPGPSPWDLKNTIFSVFLPLNYVIFVFTTRVLKLFAMWKDQGSLLHGKELTSPTKELTLRHIKFIFRTSLATIYENFCSGPPLEKILGAPL